jgi:DNA (cytosine-5)-methyltransferase 1
MSSTPSFTFSDLFAGIGGFHAALHAAGGTWAFASEIDPDAAAVYDHNWLRPLREAGTTPPAGVGEFRVSGDIVPLTDPEVKVPRADVLAAGFPCQPFSKSGFQRGMDETRGTLFWNIARILQDPERRPSVVLLENVRNLAGPRHEDTFATIVTTLRQLGYRTADRPAVFSPHLLPRHLGGRPQVRERVFILAHYVGFETAQDPANFDDPIVDFKSLDMAWKKTEWNLARDLPLEADDQVDNRYRLDSGELKMIQVWDALLTAVAERLDEGERLPGFPIWADEWRTLEEASDLIDVMAARGTPFPGWKRNFLVKNAEFYERHAAVLDRFRFAIDSFPPSRRKFEWQAGAHCPLSETIMHFRPSGIRAKRQDYVPALVAITQTSILGDRRRLTPREAARLQGLPESFEFRHSDPDLLEGSRPQRDAASYKQMGNGVNVGAAYFLFRLYVERFATEIPEHIVEAVLGAPTTSDRDTAMDGLRQHDHVEASDITSIRAYDDGFAPARDKLEAVNRLSSNAGGPPESLGTGSKERKSVLVTVGRCLGLPESSFAASKPNLARNLVETMGGSWDDECWSTGSTVTLEGLNRILRPLEQRMQSRPRHEAAGTSPAEEGQRILDVVVRHTPRTVRGRDAVTEMRLAHSMDWAKSEWPGFYFEYVNLGPLMSSLGGAPAKTDNPRVVLDLQAQHVWDLKVHRKGVVWTILNDKAATDWVLSEHGGIGLVVLTAAMEFDEDFGEWFRAERLRHGKTPRGRNRPASYSRRLKSAARMERLDVLYFTRDGWQCAVDRGVVRGWGQPPQPGGQPRNAKYQIALDAAGEWIVASHEW